MKEQKQIKLPAIIQEISKLPDTMFPGALGKYQPVYCHMRVTVWFKSLEEMEAFTDITVKQEGDTPTAFNPVSVIFKGRDA